MSPFLCEMAANLSMRITLQKWTDVPDTIEPRRFTTRVAARQEIRLERVSKKEAKVREEQAAHVQNLPRKRFSPQYTNQNNDGYRGGRGGESLHPHVEGEVEGQLTEDS